jgi:imidazolonepropionase-like amidohydrolase
MGFYWLFRVSHLPVRQKFVEHELDIVKKLHQAGVPFLAGTDTPAGVDVLPGFSLHLELQRFVAAGFTPMEALQTATVNPAKFLGKEADFGTVEKGKIADLVLLEANPLDDIANTRKISAVFSNGRYYSRAQLDRILADVQAYSASH